MRVLSDKQTTSLPTELFRQPYTSVGRMQAEFTKELTIDGISPPLDALKPYTG